MLPQRRGFTSLVNKMVVVSRYLHSCSAVCHFLPQSATLPTATWGIIIVAAFNLTSAAAEILFLLYLWVVAVFFVFQLLFLFSSATAGNRNRCKETIHPYQAALRTINADEIHPACKQNRWWGISHADEGVKKKREKGNT